MTQEDKARKYDEALERAEVIYQGSYKPDTAATIAETLQNVFPELKESEGERIRKALLEMVHDTTGDELWIDYNVHKEEALAWLEKHKKQESVEEIVERCKTSWYNEGKIQGQIEGLSDEEKYQQGWHDALEKQGKTFTKRDVDDAYLKGISDAKNELEKQGGKPQGKTALDAINEEVQKLHDHLEMHKQLPKSEPQTVTFIDSGTMQVIEKLDEIIGKLGDIHEVLSNHFQFPYMDYTPPSPVPGMDVWYKTHGVERVTPVTCETIDGLNKSKDNESK